MIKYNVSDCRIVGLKKKYLLGVPIVGFENNNGIPFNIKRCYFLYDIPNKKKRGAHAHKNLMQLIIAVSGSFDICLDDGVMKQKFTLNSPYKGLFVVSGIWRDLENFSPGAVCLVFASELYDESDYIRNYDDFLKYRQDNV